MTETDDQVLSERYELTDEEVENGFNAEEEQTVIYENMGLDFQVVNEENECSNDEENDSEGFDEEYDSEEMDECDSDYEHNYVIEESEQEDGLEDYEFSDDEDEVLEARKKIRQCRLYRDRDMAANVNALSEQTRQDKYVKSTLYAKNCHHEDFKFELGMKFADAKECREAVITWNVLNGRNIRWVKSGKQRLQAECVEDCNWKLYASKLSAEPTFVIKILRDTHSCAWARRNRQVTSKWLATQLLEVFKRNPNIEATQLKKDVSAKYDINVKLNMCYRARTLALRMIRGSYMEDYNKLRSYVSELSRTDKEGRFELKTRLNKKGDCIFQRIYIGFSALRKGFLIGCRKLIGFDGCFLKTVLGGVLLAAVGKDCNNQMYPIAWAVVEQETTETWYWFCEILLSEFGITDGLGWSFMSDKQKGLINALRSLAPNAEHRHCARHVYANWKPKFGGPKFYGLFWGCVKASTMQKYEETLNLMKLESTQAFDEFCSRGPGSFCKPLLNSFVKTDTTNNNICETFNSYIISSREKSILHLLEDIRKSLMVRLHDIRKKMEKCQDKVCPNIMKILVKLDRKTKFCNLLAAGDEKYEVTCFSDTFNVDLVARVCSCIDWHLTGIPCIHAYACINHARLDVRGFVDEFYYKTTCLATYRLGLQPLLGEKEWPKVNEIPIQPPYVKRHPGRPKKNRKRAAHEFQKQDAYPKLTKHGVKMKCSNCGGIGHNKRSCSHPTLEVGNVIKTPSSTSSSTGRKSVSHPSDAARTQLGKDKRKAAQGIGLFVADSGNVLWRGNKRSQLLATSRAPNDCVQIGGSSSTSEQVSQVIDPIPPP